MEKWIATGISGSGRIEKLIEISQECEKRGFKALVSDVGTMIKDECQKHRIPYTDQTILDIDRPQLSLLRSSALKECILKEVTHNDANIHFIGIHATFRWKKRLIPGMSFRDILAIKPNGFINMVDNLETIMRVNHENPKWVQGALPNHEITQEWLKEEEFATEVLAEVIGVPIYLVAKNHNTSNLTDLFVSGKKKVYLSYPITAVREESPELLENIQINILPQLEEMFVVFDPLAIEDMKLTYEGTTEDLPELATENITTRAKDLIKARTIERDFQFIDQADAVVVFYMTDKLSPGVMAEINYAHRNQKPIFLAFPHSKSPFMEDVAHVIKPSIDELMPALKEFANG